MFNIMLLKKYKLKTLDSSATVLIMAKMNQTVTHRHTSY